jgi:hypothetical protein
MKYGHLPSKEAEAEPWERLCVDLIGPYTIVKQDSSVTEFTKSQSLAASTVTTSLGDSSISTDSVKSRTSKKPLEQPAGGQAACVLLLDPM